MEVAILIEPGSLEKELGTYSTSNTYHGTERTIIVLVHLHSIRSSEINYSEINVIKMCSMYFITDNKIIIKQDILPMTCNSHHTEKAILELQRSFSVTDSHNS